MMTAGERIMALHTRMASLQRKKERRKTAALSAVCTVLSLCLIVMVFGFGTLPGRTAGMYSGAMMLYENAGPYVIVALAAFTAGVVITVILLQDRFRREAFEKTQSESENVMK